MVNEPWPTEETRWSCYELKVTSGAAEGES